MFDFYAESGLLSAGIRAILLVDPYIYLNTQGSRVPKKQRKSEEFPARPFYIEASSSNISRDFHAALSSKDEQGIKTMLDEDPVDTVDIFCPNYKEALLKVSEFLDELTRLNISANLIEIQAPYGKDSVNHPHLSSKAKLKLPKSTEKLLNQIPYYSQEMFIREVLSRGTPVLGRLSETDFQFFLKRFRPGNNDLDLDRDNKELFQRIVRPILQEKWKALDQIDFDDLGLKTDLNKKDLVNSGQAQETSEQRSYPSNIVTLNTGRKSFKPLVSDAPTSMDEKSNLDGIRLQNFLVNLVNTKGFNGKTIFEELKERNRLKATINSMRTGSPHQRFHLLKRHCPQISRDVHLIIDEKVLGGDNSPVRASVQSVMPARVQDIDLDDRTGIITPGKLFLRDHKHHLRFHLVIDCNDLVQIGPTGTEINIVITSRVKFKNEDELKDFFERLKKLDPSHDDFIEKLSQLGIDLRFTTKNQNEEFQINAEFINHREKNTLQKYDSPYGWYRDPYSCEEQSRPIKLVERHQVSLGELVRSSDYMQTE